MTSDERGERTDELSPPGSATGRIDLEPGQAPVPTAPPGQAQGSSGEGSPDSADRPGPEAADAEPAGGRPALDEQARRAALQRSIAGQPPAGPASAGPGSPGKPAAAATAATTGAGAAPGSAPRTGAEASTTVLPGPPGRRPERPLPRPEGRPSPPRAARPTARPVSARSRRARLVVKRVDPWSVFLFSLVASICLGIVLLVAVAALYAALSSLGVLASVNTVLGEVLGGGGPEEVAAPFITPGRVLGATAVLAAVDVVLLTVLATLSALLYNLCASLTGGVEVVLGERD